MLPSAELDNYKLQVELLQEKLKRSEESRQKLEHKLENAFHKKAEHEKVLRAKQRKHYEEFVNEVEKRNERNRQLKQMLERIEQQTSALSARSEKLRMMKYEMYFAKLVQSQTMRCIVQGTTQNVATAPTPIPVLLPTTPSPSSFQQHRPAIITAMPIKNNENDPAMITKASAEVTPSAIYHCDVSGNLIAAPSNISKPASVSYTISANGQLATQEMPPHNTITSGMATATATTTTTTATEATPLSALTTGMQHWTLAMATPTPNGILLTTPTVPATPMPLSSSNVAANIVSGIPAYDIMQYPCPYPFGYSQRAMRHLLKPKPNASSIYSDESDVLLQAMDANTKSDYYFRTNKTNDRGNQSHSTATDENCNRIYKSNIGSSNQMDLPTRQFDNDKGEGVGVNVNVSQDNGNGNANSHQQPEQEWLQNQQQQQQQQWEQHQKPEQLLSKMSTTSPAAPVTLDKLPKTMAMTEQASVNSSATATALPSASTSISFDEWNNNADDGGKTNWATRFDETSQDLRISGGGDSTSALISTERKSHAEQPPTDALGGTTTPSNVISNDNGNYVDTTSLRPTGIDNIMMPSGQRQLQQQRMTQSWQQETENSIRSGDDKDNESTNNAPVIDETVAVVGEGTEMEIRKYPKLIVDNNNQLSMKASQNNEKNPMLSIEKIENEIYGELVNPPTTNELSVKNVARNAAQGLVNELVIQQNPEDQQQQQERQQHEMNNYENVENSNNATTYANYVENEQQQSNALNVAYDEQSNSESYDPSYATIEGTTNAEIYEQPSIEMGYNDDQNIPSAYVESGGDDLQQQYDNGNYENYDPSQYTTTDVDGSAFDPNVQYPGYTYDAVTGQYTADPSMQQYANTEATEEAYNPEGAAYEQQAYDTLQQNPQYDYTNYTQESTNDGNVAPQVNEQINLTQDTTPPAQTNVPAVPSSNTKSLTSSNKPTSILSSAEKHAATNDAQKKKKRVNFVDSSETDDSSSVKQQNIHLNAAGAGSESDFDFSASEKSSGSGNGI